VHQTLSVKKDSGSSGTFYTNTLRACGSLRQTNSETHHLETNPWMLTAATFSVMDASRLFG